MDGNVKCFGNDFNGILTNDPDGYGNVDEAVLISNSEGAIDLSVDSSTICIRYENSDVACWGDNGSAQLGLDELMVSNIPVQVSGLNNVVMLTQGNNSSWCALMVDQTVKCWGANGANEMLGASDEIYQGTPIAIPDLTAVSTMSMGNNYGCAHFMNGDVKCWGNGNPLTTISNLSDASSVVAGDNSGSCAITITGTVKCWGTNSAGHFGDGTQDTNLAGVDYFTAVSVPGVSNVTKLNIAGNKVCALRGDLSVLCWGTNSYGEFGLGDNTGRLTPTEILPAGSATDIFLGPFNIFYRDLNGDVFSSGLSSFGNYASSQNGGFFFFEADHINNLNTAISSIGSSTSHQCTLGSNQNVYCWGFGYSGMLGDGEDTYDIDRNTSGVGFVSTPVQVSISNVTQIAVNAFATCALKSDQTVWCWGENRSGALGQGTRTGILRAPSSSFVVQGLD